MTPYRKRMNPYVRRMAEDMHWQRYRSRAALSLAIRNFADSTIDAYTYLVDRFCRHFGRTADQLGLEEIREYQVFLVKEKKASWSSFNQAVCVAAQGAANVSSTK